MKKEENIDGLTAVFIGWLLITILAFYFQPIIGGILLGIPVFIAFIGGVTTNDRGGSWK